MEALLRQMLEGGQEAWAGVEQCLGETVRSWLRDHPSKEAACCWESEEYYVSLAFGRFRKAVKARQLQAHTSSPTALRYLLACLNGVLLDSLRAKGGAKGMTLQEPAHAEEQAEETSRLIANCGNAFKVCFLMSVSGVWPTYSFIVT